jgi:hypothetical protein
MNPIRLILGVEAASTGGGILTDVAKSEAGAFWAKVKLLLQ